MVFSYNNIFTVKCSCKLPMHSYTILYNLFAKLQIFFKNIYTSDPSWKAPNQKKSFHAIKKMHPVLFKVSFPSLWEKCDSRINVKSCEQWNFFLHWLGLVVQPLGSASDKQFPVDFNFGPVERLLVGNTQVAIYSMKHRSWPKYTSATVMTGGSEWQFWGGAAGRGGGRG